MRPWKKIAILFVFLGLFLPSKQFSEQFSVENIQTVVLPSNLQKESVKISSGIEDAVRILFSDDMVYVCGIELNMKIPEEIVAAAPAVSYAIYEDVKKNQNNHNMEGFKSFSATIPPKLSLNVYIPLTEAFPVKDSPYSERIPLIPKTDDGSIFIRFQNVLKSESQKIAKKRLLVEIKPVLMQKGLLHLEIAPEDEAHIPSLKKIKKQRGSGSYTIFVDDKQLEGSQNVFLSEGEHHASIVSDSYRNELRTFIVERGKTTNLFVELRSIEPTLMFICPVNTKIYFDGAKIEDFRKTFLIDAGEHSVKMRVGDYEVVRNFVASYGKSYTISLDIDATIREEQ